MILEAKSIVITLTSNGQRRSIGKIEFGSKGDLYIFFSKFKPSHGLVSLLTMRANPPTTSVSLAEPGTGKVTNHIVKFTHHVDGRAHFSQDGKVFTKVFKQSTPLNKQQTHIFTIQVQGFQNFPEFKKKPNTQTLNFDVDENQCLKIIGRWFKKTSVSQRIGSIEPNAKLAIMSPGGIQYGAGYSPPIGNPSYDFFLFLEPKAIPPLDNDNSPTLSLVGGFDPPEIASDLSKDTSFLGMLYPCSDPSELENKIGTIDFRPQ